MSVTLGANYVRTLAPYQTGKPIAEVAREYGFDPANIVKLASNENPLGMPDSAKKAIIDAIAEISRYPDANGFCLKQAISNKYNLPRDWITLGNGSNDILELAAHTFVQPNQEVIYSQYSFLVYELISIGVGARAIKTPAQNYGHDLAAMAKAITADTKLIFIANPNNPTGTFLPGQELEQFLNKVPENAIVVLDEAYTEFLAPELRYDSISCVKKYPNLIVSRTFSKAYGLAGLRVGFAIAQPHVTDLLNRIRQPFNVNTLAQSAAVAALNDHVFLEKSASINRAGYQQLTQAFDEMGLTYVPSLGNFVMFKAGNQKDAGERVNLALLKQGIIVRPVANYGLPEWLRVSIGLPAENATFLTVLKSILQSSTY